MCLDLLLNHEWDDQNVILHRLHPDKFNEQTLLKFLFYLDETGTFPVWSSPSKSFLQMTECCLELLVQYLLTQELCHLKVYSQFESVK